MGAIHRVLGGLFGTAKPGYDNPEYLKDSWNWVQQQNEQGLMDMDAPKPDDQVPTSPGMADWQNKRKKTYESRSAEVEKNNSPVERWKRQINNLMNSGHPALQKQAINMMGDYHKRATLNAEAERTRNRPAKTATPTSIKEYQYAQTQGYSGSYQDWIASKKTKMFEEKVIGHNDRFQNAKGEEVAVPSGTTLAEVKQMGLYPYKSLAGDSAGKTAMLETSKQQFPIIDEHLFSGDGSINQDVINGMFAIENAPLGLGDLATKHLSPNAQKVYAAFETGMQAITRTETGAAMPQEEVANTKKRFMPKPFDTPEVQLQKIKAFKYFINNAADMLNPSIASNKGLTPTRIVNKAFDKAMKLVSEDNNSNNWVKDGYEYRKDASGKVQRRKIQ